MPVNVRIYVRKGELEDALSKLKFRCRRDQVFDKVYEHSYFVSKPEAEKRKHHALMKRISKFNKFTEKEK